MNGVKVTGCGDPACARCKGAAARKSNVFVAVTREELAALQRIAASVNDAGAVRLADKILMGDIASRVVAGATRCRAVSDGKAAKLVGELLKNLSVAPPFKGK